MPPFWLAVTFVAVFDANWLERDHALVCEAGSGLGAQNAL